MSPWLLTWIADMDGLLLNTEAFYTIVQRNLLADYGKEFTWELKSNMMGMKAMDAAEYLVNKLDIQDRLPPQDFLKKRDAALHEMFPKAKLMPGVERLLTHLSKNKIPICLATSSHYKHVQLKTQRHSDLFQLFLHRVTGDQVTRGKPAPDIFIEAAQKFSPPATPGSCLVFEDAPSGVAAGKAAGSVVMVPDSCLDIELTKEADQVLTSLLDFDPTEWGLPAFP